MVDFKSNDVSRKYTNINKANFFLICQLSWAIWDGSGELMRIHDVCTSNSVSGTSNEWVDYDVSISTRE